MKQIQLTKGKVALVDDEDFEELSKYNWSLQGCYAARWKSKRLGDSIGGSVMIYMHRFILGLGDRKEKNLEVDHINNNKLDNRKENLRICTHAKNIANSKKKSNSASKYKGVNKHPYGWQVLIWNGIKNINIGLFNRNDEEDAARAYDKAAKKIHGIYAWLNFPDE